MKRWISVALWLCLVLVIGAYGGVTWYLQAANAPARMKMQDKSATPALAYQAAPSGQQNHSQWEQFPIQEERYAAQPRAVVSDMRPANSHAANTIHSTVQFRNTPVGEPQFNDAMPEFPSQLVSNNEENVPAQFVSDSTGSRFAPAAWGSQDAAVNTASHQQFARPEPDPRSRVADPARQAAPSLAEVANPMDGMKIAVLISKQPNALQTQIEQRRLGGQVVRVVGASIHVPASEIKIYASSVELSDDQQPHDQQPEETVAADDELVQQPVDAVANRDTDLAGDAAESDSTDLDDTLENPGAAKTADDEPTASEPAELPASPEDKLEKPVGFQIVCDGPVVVVTPNGLIRGKGLHYADHQFKIGSAVIENADTVITAGEITFPFEIGNLQLIPIGLEQAPDGRPNPNSPPSFAESWVERESGEHPQRRPRQTRRAVPDVLSEPPALHTPPSFESHNRQL